MRNTYTLFFLASLAVTPAWSADYKASVRWASKVSLSIPVSGVVESVNVVPGKPVNKGELLLALQEAPFRANVNKAQAALQNSESVLKETKRDRDQAKELYERAVLSTVSLENAKMKYLRAVSTRKEKQSLLELARYELGHSRLYAPFDAWVLERNIEPGQAIVSTLKSEPVITIARRGQYLARLWLNLHEHRKLKLGTAASVRVMNKHAGGKVYALSLEPEQSGKHVSEYWVDVSFPWQGNPLRQGEQVEISFD